MNICSTFGVSGLLLFFIKRHYDKKDESLKEGKQERKEIKEAIEKIAKQNEEQYQMIASQNDNTQNEKDYFCSRPIITNIGHGSTDNTGACIPWR